MGEENNELDLSPLGRDPDDLPTMPNPADEAENQQEETSESTSNDEREETGVRLSREEYDTLLQGARNYDIIQRNPGLSRIVQEHLIGDLTGANPPKSAPKSDTSSDGEADPRYAELETRLNNGEQILNQLTNALKSMAMENFILRNPDYNKYENSVKAIMREHSNLTPQQAYEFAKLRAMQGKQVPNGTEPVRQRVPATEDGAGLLANPKSNPMVEKAILNRKAVSFDQAIDLALKAALNQSE